MNGWLTILLLLISNTFMTIAWYGQLKLEQMKLLGPSTPLFWIILGSWGVAFLEYIFLVPANRYGFEANGGAFNILQLKVIQECISLGIFTVFVLLCFKGQQLHWNHFLAFVLLVLAVYLVFMDSK